MKVTAGRSVRRCRKMYRSRLRVFPATLGSRRGYSLHSAEDGQSMVEFGLIVPLLLLVLTGIFSFGIIFNQYELLTNAANSAARYFAASRNPNNNNYSLAKNEDPCAYMPTITQQDLPNFTTSSLKYTIVYTVSATTTVNKLSNNLASPTCADLVMTQGDTVQVTATYPVSATLFGWATKNLTLSASSTELVQ